MYDILFNPTIGWVIYTLLLIRFICLIISSIDFNSEWFIFLTLGTMLHIGIYTLIYLKIPNDIISILICIFIVYEIFITSKMLNENYNKIKFSSILIGEVKDLPLLFISTHMTYLINITIGIIYILYFIYYFIG